MSATVPQLPQTYHQADLFLHSVHFSTTRKYWPDCDQVQVGIKESDKDDDTIILRIVREIDIGDRQKYEASYIELAQKAHHYLTLINNAK